MNKSKKQRGITLIALVITIIVMLILVAVTISMAVNGGLFKKAGEAVGDTQNAITNEQVLASGQVTIDGATYNSIDEFIEVTKGIEDKSITVTSSEQEIKFEKTITKAHVSYEKKDYQAYEIKGISLEKDGEYITTGTLTGKSGNLEIVGDIKDTTFLYTLTDLMKEDEVFYCKVDIDGENYYQELKVIQGESIFYEEDFLGIKVYYKSSGEECNEMDMKTVCNTVEGDVWSSGKAIEFRFDSNYYLMMELDYWGSKIDLIWGQTEKNSAGIIYEIINSNFEPKESYLKVLDSETLGRYEFEIRFKEKYSSPDLFSLAMIYDSFFDTFGLGYAALTIDGVRIWK